MTNRERRRRSKKRPAQQSVPQCDDSASCPCNALVSQHGRRWMDDVNLYVIWRSLTSKNVATSRPRTNPNPSLDLREFDGFMPGSEADLLRRAAGEWNHETAALWN